ncbi:MAG: hypothetical protein Q9195_005889 [Heterodermia aff. obscurata]
MELLGSNVINKFDAQLPFLPKILSIAKALPLQIHPNKDLSAKLHAKDPKKFTDENHKPEIAIALGPFEVFAGFKRNSEIQILFDRLEPLKKFLPSSDGNFSNESVKTICLNILNSSDEIIRDTQKGLQRFPREAFGEQAYILDILPRLQEQYSVEDPGNLVALLTMNFLTLSAGDAIYVPADAPHAYLSGDIVECMARSNNVLNTGFCPRADMDNIELFTAALTFSPHSAKEVLLKSTTSERGRNRKTMEYKPDMSEFNMLKTTLGNGDTETIETISGPSVLFVISGSGKLIAEAESYELNRGYVFFVGQGVETIYEAGQGLVVYRAYAE